MTNQEVRELLAPLSGRPAQLNEQHAGQLDHQRLREAVADFVVMSAPASRRGRPVIVASGVTVVVLSGLAAAALSGHVSWPTPSASPTAPMAAPTPTGSVPGAVGHRRTGEEVSLPHDTATAAEATARRPSSAPPPVSPSTPAETAHRSHSAATPPVSQPSDLDTLPLQNALFSGAAQAEQRGQFELARTKYQELLERFPRSPLASEARAGLNRTRQK